MNVSIIFTRIFFTLLSVFFLTIYTSQAFPGALGIIGGIVLGLVIGLCLVSLDFLFKRFNLRSFNTMVLGLFFGYLMGQALVIIFTALLKISLTLSPNPIVIEVVEMFLFLLGIYLGLIFTVRGSQELFVSVPFIKFDRGGQKRRDLTFDVSALSDPRILDLASSGLIDHMLILPRFLVKELYVDLENSNQETKQTAKQALDHLKKLEEMPFLGLRYNENDFLEIKDFFVKLTRFCRLIDANLLTSNLNAHIAPVEGLKIINLNNLSNALKPLAESGEMLKIKIQRYGKEPRQGIGYLEDGTMVVVNGGGDFIGETIDAYILSVKHTSTGRIIFCNATEEN